MQRPVLRRVQSRRLWQPAVMSIVDLLAPKSCVLCGMAGTKMPSRICAGCHADMPWNETPISPLSPDFDCRIALLHYEFPIDAAIKAFKFNRKLYYGRAFAELLCADSRLLPVDIDVVLPVPLHWRRKMRRGFNQASELARPLAAFLGVPLLRGVRRRRATACQTGLQAAERIANLRQAFDVRDRVSQRHVLIVDDVITTGATVTQLARALRKQGARKISVMALAQA